MEKIIIPGNPISVNSMYTGRRFLTEKAKTMKEANAWEIKKQWRQRPMIAGTPISIRFRVFFKTKKSRDLDNVCKALQDSMTGIVYEDDSQIDELHVYRDFDSRNPRVEISVEILASFD